MRQSRFSEEQIIGILKEDPAGLAVAEIWRRHGISDATFYTWRSKYGGLEVSEEGARGREPQAQEAVCRADAGRGDAARDAGKKLLTSSSRRQAVRWAIEHKGYSQRRAG